MGFGLCKLMSKALETELYRIPFVLNASTYGLASVTILCASALSALMVRRKINKLDLITALKIRE
jgi:putative ABC transport system permease protein